MRTLGALCVAVLLWVLASLNRSLWQDEFHSLYHASALSLRAMLESVRGDNHPPLSFLLQRASLALFGENAFALRLPSLLAGVGLFLVFVRLSRRLADPRAQELAPWLAACSSYLVLMVSTARMYALLALATLGLVESALAVLEGTRSRWWIAAWVALGLHSHYGFFHDLALIGVAGLALYASSARHRAALQRCLLPGLVGLVLFVPWAKYAFGHQLGTGDPPTSSYRGWLVWLESYGHMLFINSRLGGDLVTYAVALPWAAVGAFFGGVGVVRLVRDVRAGREPGFSLALLALAVLGPSWIYLASLVSARSGFHTRYLASFAAPALLIVAAGVPGSAARRNLGRALMAAMLALALVNAFSAGRQDVRGAVEFILEHAQPGDAVIVRAWWFRDPERSPTDYGWYARRLAHGRAGPAEIPLEKAPEALSHPRVWLIHSVGYRAWVPSLLGDHFRTLERFPFGPDASVDLYSGPRDSER